MNKLNKCRIKAVMYDVVGYTLREMLDYQIHMIISLEGRINESRLSKAFLLSLKTEPVLSSRFVDNWLKPYWQVDEGFSLSNCFDVIETKDKDAEIIKFLTTPFNPFSSPQVRILILRSDADTICIKVDHLVADAMGVKEFGYLLADIYRKLSDNPDYVLSSNSSGSRSSWQLFRHVLPGKIFEILRAAWKNLQSPAYWRPVETGKTAQRHPYYIFRNIPAERFSIIKEHARKMNVTINDVFITAYFRALHKIIGPMPGVDMSVMTTADLRRYIPGGKTEAICALSGFYYPSIGRVASDSFDETLVKVHAEITSLKSSAIGLGDSLLLLPVLKLLPFGIVKKIMPRFQRLIFKESRTVPALTNMGIIDKRILDFADTEVQDVFLTPSMSLIGTRAIPVGISTFNGSVSMSLGFMGTENENKVMSILMNSLLDELPD